MGGTTAPTPPAPAVGGGGADLGLMDIFGGPPAPTPAPAVPTEIPMDAYEKAGLKIQFMIRREATPNTYTVVARFGNLTGIIMNNFVFEAAVPKYLQLRMEPATGQVLMPQSSNVTQS